MAGLDPPAFILPPNVGADGNPPASSKIKNVIHIVILNKVKDLAKQIRNRQANSVGAAGVPPVPSKIEDVKRIVILNKVKDLANHPTNPKHFRRML